MSKKHNHHKAGATATAGTATPETHKKKETFVLKAPEAQKVFLLGDFTKWQEQPIPLQKVQDGTWQATLEMEPGQYSYRFLVDGKWQDDPECSAHVPNPFGGINSVRQIA